ncbi:MAG: DUF3883 domain-containing protein [Chloroflexi bacterium]|nr:DUF3883 domain-containing protein [Chloroflexota bacterium]
MGALALGQIVRLVPATDRIHKGLLKNFSDIKPDDRLIGVIAEGPIAVIRIQSHGRNTATLTYERPDGGIDRRLIQRSELGGIARVAERGRPFSADGADFRLALEALRIAESHYIDPYAAVAESRIEPYPHQIEAVYEVLLRQQPISFVLADDPGAGKTIMSGLLIKELMLRGVVRRCLVIAPGSLVEQWQDELAGKFALDFRLMSRNQIEESYTGNPFAEDPLWIARIDQLARAEDMLARVGAVEWDLVIVDEAHKMAAHVYGSKVERTLAYQLGELLRERTRHLLLLTATPHNGKDNDFLAFMSLVDADRFAGRLRPGQKVPDLEGALRRKSKEKLTDFDGKPLFPRREARTLRYDLSDAEKDLYRKVTAYVRDGLAKAQRMRKERDEIRGLAVGFALTSLQRRLASSPAAIYRSLERRHRRLTERLDQLRREADSGVGGPDLGRWQRRAIFGFDPDDYSDEDVQILEESLLEGATAARTVEELAVELEELSPLVPQAEALRRRRDDAKWRRLREAVVRDADDVSEGQPVKLIIFSEYVDTIEYLRDRLQDEFGRPDSVLVIHGRMRRQDRRQVQDQFRVDPIVRVLLATDAAGEGVNLQAANMVVNYDLPWNPNRIEQRFGRVHRIGQRRTCYLWNLLAEGTREGVVFDRLFAKIESIRAAVGNDSVYDILGDAELNRSLRELLERAIMEADSPESDAYMQQRLEDSFDRQFQNAMNQQALVPELRSVASTEQIRRDMDRAQLKKLQPYHVRAFFMQALRRFGGTARPRERGRFEITRVPAALRAGPSGASEVHLRYGRIAFERQYLRVRGRAEAELISPSHPLTRSLVEAVTEKYGQALQDGAMLQDPHDRTADARVLYCLEHSVADGTGTVISKRIQYVELLADGSARDPGDTPHLDYEPYPNQEMTRSVADSLATLGGTSLDEHARNWAIESLSAAHLAECQRAIGHHIAKTRRLVRRRMTEEIRHIDAEHAARRRKNAGPSPTRSPRGDELEARLSQRERELDCQAELISRPPVIRAAAIVIPQQMLSGSRPSPNTQELRERTDRLAIVATLAAERRLGREPSEQPHANPGYDVLSRDPEDGREFFIEVKGHLPDTGEVSISATQILHSKSSPERWRLSLVEVPHGDESQPRVRYLKDPFEGIEIDSLVAKIQVRVNELEARSEDPN